MTKAPHPNFFKLNLRQIVKELSISALAQVVKNIMSSNNNFMAETYECVMQKKILNSYHLLSSGVRTRLGERQRKVEAIDSKIFTLGEVA